MRFYLIVTGYIVLQFPHKRWPMEHALSLVFTSVVTLNPELRRCIHEELSANDIPPFPFTLI